VDSQTEKQLKLLGAVLLILALIVLYGPGDKRQQDDDNSIVQSMQEIQTEEMTSAPEPETSENAAAKFQNKERIRVLICSDNYQSEYHSDIVMQCTGDYVVKYGDKEETCSSEDMIHITADSPWLSEGTVYINPVTEDGEFQMPVLIRSQPSPSYAGSFEIVKREDGLLLINELPLETYLCSVVPSEMPAKYPIEALKAQAICARTYAIEQMNNNRGDEFGVDVDDSVSYQVYNNIAQNEQTTKAVRETAGQIMTKDDMLVNALYFSTSCGINISQDMSEEAVFCAFISNSDEKTYEKEEPWYRWSTVFTLEEITRLVNARQQAGFGNVTGLEIESRESNGSVKTLVVQGENNSLKIDGEYKIRKLLQTDGTSVTLQDGNNAPNLGMLPSAFFYLTPNYEGEALVSYTLTGGGYGHGKGMSQNGAKHMAEAGKDCEEILKYYYGEVQIGKS